MAIKQRKSTLRDLTGQVFGRLTVLSRADKKETGQKVDVKWLCQCICGNLKTVRSYTLACGDSKSCGCLRIDVTTKRLTTHGLCGTKRYSLYKSAFQRSKQDKLPFNLDLVDIPNIPEICPVLGIQIKSNNGRNGSTGSSPSLDRIIPSLGYVKNNIRIISHRANQLKSDSVPQELILMAIDAKRMIDETTEKTKNSS